MIKDLEAAIGYKFKNIALLQNALAHSSYANERWHNSLMSNERLEFLGDSILGMCVAEYLYCTFPDRPEGELTRMRADMVCEQTLANVAGRIGLGEHLLLGKGEEQGGGRTRNSSLADAVESVIAASFLDGGMSAAKQFIQKFILVEVPVKKLLDYREIGGTQFLGIKKAVIKAHGSSDALAFRNAINQAAKAAEADFSQELETGLKELAALQEAAE